MSKIMSISKSVYKYSIITTGCIGVTYGSIDGFYHADNTCFIKKNLTYGEYCGEVFCYGLIVSSSMMTYGVLSALYTTLFPVTIPLTHVIMNKIR